MASHQPHCEKYLNARTFYNHKKNYYNRLTEVWQKDPEILTNQTITQQPPETEEDNEPLTTDVPPNTENLRLTGM